MKDTNEIKIVGRVSRIKTAFSAKGEEYARITIAIEDPRNADEEGEYNRYNIIYVSAFKRHVLNAIRRENIRSGNRILLKGYLSSYKVQVRGTEIYMLGVVAREVELVHKIEKQ